MNIYNCINDITTKKYPYIFYIQNDKKKFSFVGNHTFFDGISSNELIQKMFLSKSYVEIKKIKKIPLKTEMILMKSLPLFVKLPKKRNLNKYINWQKEINIDELYPKFLKKKIPIQYIKNIKSKLNVSFMAVLSGIICKNIFSSCNKNKLNLSITCGFKSKYHFNNFGVIIITSIKNSLENIILSNHKNINKNKLMALSSNYAMNIYSSKWTINSIDVIISSLPISNSNLYLSSGELIKESFVYVPNCSAPVWAGCLTLNDNVNIGYGIRSKDINLGKFEKY